MKKLMVVLLVLMTAGLFSVEWYSARGEILNETLKAPRETKDSTWYGYYGPYALYWTMAGEKGVYVNANDFGLEYPVRLHALDAFWYEPGYTYSYKIYAKDGTSLLWEMPEPGTAADDFYNIYAFETPLVMKDDFWVSAVPLEGTHPALVSTDVVSSDHSYYMSEGVWAPMLDVDERYEWCVDFAMSPFTGDDTYPPSLREITEGTENFIGIDAELVMMIQDQSVVVTPTTGQYSVDGGTNWTDFTVSYISDAVKGSYLFGGTIPGQPDGTTALVHVYLEDELGNSATSDDFEVVWSRYVPVLIEDFEDEFPPEGWTLAPGPTGIGFEKGSLASGAEVHGGNSSLMHYYNETDTDDDWIWTFDFPLPSDGSCLLSFWQKSRWIIDYELQQVVVSNDEGVSFDVIYEGHPTMDPEDPEFGSDWENLGLLLSAYAGQTVRVGFHYSSPVGGWGPEWYIDDVSILYDGDAPVLVDIVANESLYPNLWEYYSNNMVINVTFEDLTGVAECMGYYSFDGGTTIDSVAFAKSKATEIWTGSIPARTDSNPGTLHLEYVDIGGNADSSPVYDLQFIPDGNVPVIKDFYYGNPVFINQEMTLTLTFTDESAISTLTGWYSEDEWVSQTEVTMTQSKLREYTYTGVLPAKAAVTFAQVKFDIGDLPGNMMTSPAYTVKWLDGEDVTTDDFEAGQSAFWDWTTPGTTWAVVDNESVSPTHSLTDSPGGNYPDEKKNRLMSMPQDFSAYEAATAFFWAKIDVEPDWEFFMLQGTTAPEDSLLYDDQWVTLIDLCDYEQPWKFYEVNLGAFAGQSNVRLRVKIDSDQAVNGDGAYIDDMRIVGYFDDFAPPQIVYGGPAILEGSEYNIPREFTIPVGMGDYTFNVDLLDASDISEVKIIYSVDGGAEQEALPTVSSGPSGTYELLIPEQAAGSQVYYRISATDNSTWKNSVETKTYMIRFGNYNFYQNGDDFTDYLDIIGTGPQATAQAVAKRVTMGPLDAKGHYRSSLVGITIDAYIDEPEYPCDDIYVHIWEDDNGAPGADIIPPIFTEVACTMESSYEITYVDLRSYAAEFSNLEGDVFVGFTSAGTYTNVLYEVAANHISEPGYVAWERSWLGFDDDSNGSLDSWQHDPASVYQISAVLDVYEAVDGPLAPVGFAFANEDHDDVANLLWSARPESEFVDYYNLYRDETPGFALVTPLASISADSALVYDDGPLSIGSTYYYKLTAVDTLGFESSPSVELMYECTSGINENVPLTTELFQNYPNPFNPETSIKFTLASNSNVSLTVYNYKGEKVVGLMDGKLKAGYYNTSFNASKLVSGVYYYTLKVDGKAMTKKMMLLK